MLNVRTVISNENDRTVDLSLNTGPSLQGPSMVQQFVSGAEDSLGNEDMVRVQIAIRLLQGAAILALCLRDWNAGAANGLGQPKECGTRTENNNNKLYSRFMIEMVNPTLIG